MPAFLLESKEQIAESNVFIPSYRRPGPAELINSVGGTRPVSIAPQGLYIGLLRYARNDKMLTLSKSPSLAKGCPRSGRGSGFISPCGAMDTDLRRYDGVKNIALYKKRGDAPFVISAQSAHCIAVFCPHPMPHVQPCSMQPEPHGSDYRGLCVRSWSGHQSPW